MTRLNNDHRERIERAAVADTFDKEQAELKAQEYALFDRIYNWAVPEAERELLAKVAEHWLIRRQHFNVNAAGWRIQFSTSKPYPDKWGYDTINLTDEQLIAEVRAYADAYEDYRKRRSAGIGALENMLSMARTFEALQKSWPEGKDYWEPVWLNETNKTLPAVDVTSVNRMLGLPKEVAA